MKTSIQLSDDIRRRMKILASYRDMSYEGILEDLINVFENTIPFRSREEFSEWFELNKEKFGFRRIVERRQKFPRYRVEDEKGKEKEVELELMARDFERHGYDPKKVDLIIVAYSDRKEIAGIPVIPVVDATQHPKDVLKKIEGNFNLVSIPSPLFEKAKKRIEGTGFTSVSDYLTFMLREVVASHEHEGEGPDFSKEDEEKVKERLRALGYLD